MSMSMTGRVRWRSQRGLFGRETLVLQCEWSGTRPEHMGGYVTMEDCTEWRDATSENMSDQILSTRPASDHS